MAHPGISKQGLNQDIRYGYGEKKWQQIMTFLQFGKFNHLNGYNFANNYMKI